MDNQIRKDKPSKPKTRKMYFSVYGLTVDEAVEMVTDALFAEFSNDPYVFLSREQPDEPE